MVETTPEYVLLDHTADLGIRVYGTGLESLFENAGRALVHLIFGTETGAAGATRTLCVIGDDAADLLVRWLGEILYLIEGENLVVASVRVRQVACGRLEATLGTTPFDPAVHDILTEIKAVTYHQAEVVNRNDRWEARVIFDL
jgi:SHS2 domain-containing protein